MRSRCGRTQFAEQKRHFVASQRVGKISSTSSRRLSDGRHPRHLRRRRRRSGRAICSRYRPLPRLLRGLRPVAGGGRRIRHGTRRIADRRIPHFTRLRPLMAEPVEISGGAQAAGRTLGRDRARPSDLPLPPGGPRFSTRSACGSSKGEYVAFVGPSGSGKSTVFRLLLGFEKPESGAVFYDGKALDTLDISAVRRQIGVVLQNGKLATGSIYENICGGVQLPLERGVGGGAACGPGCRHRGDADGHAHGDRRRASALSRAASASG